MIDRVVGNKLLPANVRPDIIERTDGIPLFVEEMTKAVLEADSQGLAEYTAAAVPPPALAVPASLHASLMARLDRLGPAKEVAQIGAAIGREFSHGAGVQAAVPNVVLLRSASVAVAKNARCQIGQVFALDSRCRGFMQLLGEKLWGNLMLRQLMASRAATLRLRPPPAVFHPSPRLWM